MALRRAALIPAIGALSAISACKRTEPAPARPPTTLAFHAVGCSFVEQGVNTTCEIARGAKLRIALDESRGKGDLKALLDGRALVTTLVGPSTSNVFEIDFATLPNGAAQKLEIVDATTNARATLPISWAAERQWLVEARATREKGNVEAAIALVSSHTGAADALEAALATSALARFELARGQVAPSVAAFRKSIAAHRALGRISDATDDAFAASFALTQRSHGYVEARALLEEVAPIAEKTPEGHARLPYYQAALHAELGDRRAALAEFATAKARAEALGLGRLARNAESARATQLQLVGRAAEADRSLEALAETAARDGASPCERAEIATNRGWGALREFEGAATPELLARARRHLSEAVAFAKDAQCTDPHLRGVALGDRSWAEYRAGELAVAAATLAEARAALPSPRGTELVFWLELDALLESRAVEAISKFERARDAARALQLREAEWSITTGLGAALARARRIPEAVAALEAAESILDELALLVPLGEGRSGYLRDRRESSARLVALHLTQKNAARAFATARRARARIVRGLQAALRLERLAPPERQRLVAAIEKYRRVRDEAELARAGDWQRSTESLAEATRERAAREAVARAAVDETLALAGARRVVTLATPANGTITMLVAPRWTETGKRDADWDLFVAERETVRTIALDDPHDGADLASRLRARLPALVAPSKTINMLTEIPGLDLGSIVVNDAPLGLTVPIVSSLDLPADENAASAEKSERRALVAGDAKSDLPRAHAEATEVAEATKRELGMATELLTGADVSAPRLRAALEGALYFHYAGHAVYGGREGWDSHLPLAGGARFELADVLTLARAPQHVVLSGCEAALAEGGSVQALGLAQAFVAAGSELAVAPVRPIRDDSAAAFGRAFATALADTSANDAPARYLEAARKVAPAIRDEDRWAFRLVRR